MNRSELVRHLSLLGCVVVLLLPFMRAVAKKDRNYEQLFEPYVAACEPSGSVLPTGDGSFCGKVAVHVARGPAWSGRAFPFRTRDFSAQTPEELGSVIFVSVSHRKVGHYVTTLPRMHSHDAMEITYDVRVVDRRTKRVVAGTTIVGTPPAHSPPQSGAESAEGKANRLLCERIEEHMRARTGQRDTP
jgi:hypothetical protein